MVGCRVSKIILKIKLFIEEAYIGGFKFNFTADNSRSGKKKIGITLWLHPS